MQFLLKWTLGTHRNPPVTGKNGYLAETCLKDQEAQGENGNCHLLCYGWSCEMSSNAKQWALSGCMQEELQCEQPSVLKLSLCPHSLGELGDPVGLVFGVTYNQKKCVWVVVVVGGDASDGGRVKNHHQEMFDFFL